MTLRWKPPRHHAEIAGYHVYRSEHSGFGYVPITDRPVPAAEYSDRLATRGGQPVFMQCPLSSIRAWRAG